MKKSIMATFFEIRSVIGSVLGIIGLFLLIVGLAQPTPNKYLLSEAAAIDSNLWAGFALLLIALFMFLWLKVDPSGGAAPKNKHNTSSSINDSQP